MNSMRQVRQTATKQGENRRKANLWQEAFKKTTQAARRKKNEHMQESEEESSSNSHSRYKSKRKTDKTPRAWRTSIASGKGKMTPIGWRRQPQSGKEDSNAPWQRSPWPYKKPPMRRKGTTALRHIYDNTRVKSPTWKDRLQKTITKQKQCKDKQPTYCTRTQKEKKKKKQCLQQSLVGPRKPRLTENSMPDGWLTSQEWKMKTWPWHSQTKKEDSQITHGFASATKGCETDQACPEVTRWVAKLASAMQKKRMAVWNLAPGCARRHQGMIQGKKQRKIWKHDVQCFQILWVWSCKILYNESNNHISFQCSTRQTAWEDPAEWSNRVTNLGEVGWRSSNATSYFHRYVDVFSIGKDHWVDAHNRSKLFNIPDRWWIGNKRTSTGTGRDQ